MKISMKWPVSIAAVKMAPSLLQLITTRLSSVWREKSLEKKRKKWNIFRQLYWINRQAAQLFFFVVHGNQKPAATTKEIVLTKTNHG
jgi:hypothetical protein